MVKKKVVEPEVVVVQEVTQSILPEEINQIKTLRNNAVHLTSLAEAAYAKARLAELEAQNYILQVFNKYKLSLADGDNINENGDVVKGKKA